MLVNSIYYGSSDSNPTMTSTPESASLIDSSFAEHPEQSDSKQRLEQVAPQHERKHGHLQSERLQQL